MTPFQHKIILPPILAVVHCVLLLPLFLPISPDNHDLPFKSLPLHWQYSVPLGVTGFVVVMITKHLAVKIPLPKDPRKKRLAEGLEWTVLFLVGFLEEVWRWGVVRILVSLEGGDGGYGNVSWSRMNKAVLADSTIVSNVLGNNLWEGVYIMGWIWCCIESGFAWWSYGPHREEGRHTTSTHHHHHHHHHHNHGNRHRHDGSPHASPRSSYFPHSRGSHGVSPSTNTADNNPFLNPFRTSSIWDGPDTRPTLTKNGLSFRDPPRVEIHPSSSTDLSRPTYESQCTFGGINGFGFHTNMAAESPQSPITGTYNRDLEIAQRQVMNQCDEEYGDNVDDTYSSESESESESSSIRSSSETVRSRSATPLLSSSLPYDPNSEHPHQAFEQQSLLQSQYRRMSYNTLAEPVPAPSNTHSDDDDGDFDDEDAPQGGLAPRQYGQNYGTGGPARVSPPRPRAYPSYPSYSASYNHSYFSASPATRNRPPNLNLPGLPRSPSSSVRDGYSPIQQTHEQQQQSQAQRPRSSRLPLHHYLRMIYGVDTNSLNIWLPILWRTAALFRGLGHVLLFAWFPCLVHKGELQIWTLLMVFFIAAQKGWYTVEWVGGTVARSGVIKASVFTTALSLVVYLVGLKLWDIFP